MKKKVFLLCIGAQKCGTSWLYRYLKAHPNADMGFTKEYHIFDAMFVQECRRFFFNRVNECLEQLQSDPPLASVTNIFKLLDFYNDIENYFKYFGGLISESGGITLTGDITPSYAALPVEAFEVIKEKCRKFGFVVRIVFLMRDPVERCISAMRMGIRNHKEIATSSSEEIALRNVYASRRCEIRTRYDLTIANVERVFMQDEIYYEFYERLFNPDRIERLCGFLMIPYQTPQLDKAINVSRTGNDISEELRREVFYYYKDVYDFIYKRFGVAEMDKIWKRY